MKYRGKIKRKKFWLCVYKGVTRALNIENCVGTLFLNRRTTREFNKANSNRYKIYKVVVEHWKGYK